MNQQNPLFYEATGRGPMNAEILVDGMNTFGDSLSLLDFSPFIAKLSGATLRFSADREKADLKVYHPEHKDVEGDSASVAVYEFYGLKLSYTSGGMFVFRGVLTEMRHYIQGEDITEDKYEGFSYIPPRVESKYIPLAAEIRVSAKTEEGE